MGADGGESTSSANGEHVSPPQGVAVTTSLPCDAHLSADSDGSADQRLGCSIGSGSCPSTDWEFPLHPVLFPAFGPSLSVAQTTAPDFSSTRILTSVRPWSPSSTEGESSEKPRVAACKMAGKILPFTAIKSPDVSNSMELIDVLDAFDAFHGSEWMTPPALPPRRKDDEEKVKAGTEAGPDSDEIAQVPQALAAS